MSSEDLLAKIEAHVREGDWDKVGPLIGMVHRYHAERGLPVPADTRTRLCAAISATAGITRAVDGANGALELMARLKETAKRRPLQRVPLQTAWDSFYRLLGDPLTEVARSELHDLMLCLRDERIFDLLAKVADRAVVRDPNDARSRRLYGQALIDTGQCHAGILMLASALQLGGLDKKEEHDIIGIIGRGYKQIYQDHVAADAPQSVRQRFAPTLQSAINHYAQAYNADRDNNSYQGVNLMALLILARTDGLENITSPTGDTPEDLARRILGVLEPKAANSDDIWTQAMLGECYLALGGPENATKAAASFNAYAAKASPFALAGTVRQLEHVFRIRPGEGEEGALLALLKAAQIKADDGTFTFSGDALHQLSRYAHSPQARQYAETMVPGGDFAPIRLLQCVVSRAGAIGALCDSSGATRGSGFLLRGRHLNPAWGDDIVLLTNSHVVSERYPAPLTPSTMRVVLEGADHHRVTCEPRMLWESPPNLYDAAMLRVTSPLPEGVRPLDIAPECLELRAGDPHQDHPHAQGDKVSVIGYPLGGPLSLSVVGNISGANGMLVDIGPRQHGECDPVYLHYRAPTEQGNSGSPVFETKSDWKVVGLHHEGFDEYSGRPKLGSKPGRSHANEGISIHSIRRAAMKGG